MEKPKIPATFDDLSVEEKEKYLKGLFRTVKEGLELITETFPNPKQRSNGLMMSMQSNSNSLSPEMAQYLNERLLKMNMKHLENTCNKNV